MRHSIPDILVEIVTLRRLRIRSEADEDLEGRVAPPRRGAGRRFAKALRDSRGPAIIAEVKMGSPSLGSLAGRVDPEKQARCYSVNGAAALSVVVEPDFFHGSYELLTRCKEASGLPALAKDFVVDPIQLEWAKAAGADAVLLIAALYGKERLADLAKIAEGLGLEVLVETHDVRDVGLLEAVDCELVGVNNRDLRTFDVSLARSVGLLETLPTGAIKVAESGISGFDDVSRLRAAGFDAFLIGESLLLAEDPAAKLQELRGGEVAR